MLRNVISVVNLVKNEIKEEYKPYLTENMGRNSFGYCLIYVNFFCDVPSKELGRKSGFL